MVRNKSSPNRARNNVRAGERLEGRNLLSAVSPVPTMLRVNLAPVPTVVGSPIAGESRSVSMNTSVGAAAASSFNSYYLGTRVVHGKKFYVTLEDSGGTAQVWFRVKQNTCSSGDMLVATISGKKVTITAKTTVKDARTYQNLLDYCRLDTLAMVEIFRHLLQLP